MGDRDSIIPRAVMGIIAGGLALFVINLLMNPVPVAAGPAFVAGAIGYFFVRSNPVKLVLMLAAGGASIGVMIHRNMHLSGSSPLPPGGLLQHLATEGLFGYVAALAALLVMGLVMRVLERR
jgi:hypothetical protein